MKNELGIELTEKEILHEAGSRLASACELLFELETDEGKAAAFLADTALRYVSAVRKGDDPRHSEEFLYQMSQKTKLKVVK